MSKAPAIHSYPCPNCGANTVFGPGTGALLCDHCGQKTPIVQSVDRIAENDYRTAVADAAMAPMIAMTSGASEVQCKTCGARAQSNKHAERCAFCDSAMIVELPAEPMLLPQALLPFEQKREDAQLRFVKWLSTRWFAPFKLVARAKRDGLDGVYLPYWTYDAHTSTSYEGERGDHYWTTETYTDSNGNRQTRQVQQTRWSHASGTVTVDFDDLLVCASKSLPAALIEELEPWDVETLSPFDGRYLAGFIAERHKVELTDGFEVAKERMEPRIINEIHQDIGGDVQRISSHQTEHRNVTWKHILLPMWLSAFHYGERVFRVTVNARTGEVSGERPYSAFKITVFVLFIAALIGGLIYLFATRGR
jgi:hypothetical protein